MDFGIVQEINDGPPPPPPPPCPPGQHRDPLTGDCIPSDPTPEPCPPGQHRDASGNCVPDVEPPVPCPPGQHRDASGNCVPDSPPPPPPTGSVKQIYPAVGAPILGKFSSSNAGRFQWKFDLPKCYLAQEATCYLKIAAVDDESEEVSIKLRGGNHTDDGSLGCCYIIGIGYDGSVNSQYECPHPNNHPMSSTVVTPSPLGNSVVGKSFGIKAIVYPQGSADKIECWIDKGGLVAGKPANQWVKFWETTSTQFFGKCNGKGEEKALIRLDEIPGGDNQQNVEIAFATVQEINVSGGPIDTTRGMSTRSTQRPERKLRSGQSTSTTPTRSKSKRR